MMQQSVRTLMAGLIDYAGLFPPASLDMDDAVEAFARDSRSEQAWMLGRFVCAASRIDEFEAAAPDAMPGAHAYSGYREQDNLPPWLVAMVLDEELNAAIERASAFNEKHLNVDAGLGAIDAIELKAQTGAEIEEAIDATPRDFRLFFELPIAEDTRGLIAALAGTEACAKIRTGGVTEDAIPSPESVVRFLMACHAADVPFKATAGLHHPIRARNRLTYDDNPPTGIMHGFLNVFLAAAFIRAGGVDERDALRITEETTAENFTFEEEAVWWHDVRLDAATLAKVRETFALSFGSCSFEEPVEDLQRLGLL